MGFGGVGLRSVGSRHLRNYTVVNRTIGSDAVTTTKIAPDTIIAIDISPGAVGSSEIGAAAVTAAKVAADAIGSSHIGASAISYAEQIKDSTIGSSKIINASIYSAKIADSAVGSQNLNVNAVSYEDQVKANIIGYDKLTTGLQGSLGGSLGPNIIGTTKLKKPAADSNNIYNDSVGSRHIFFDDRLEIGAIAYPSQIKDNIIPETKFQSHFEHGRIGSIEKPLYDVILKSIDPPTPYTPMDLTYAPDKHRLWTCYLVSVSLYIFQIGTTTGNIIGSFKINTPGTDHSGIAFAPDKNHLWVVLGDIHVINKPKIIEIGTTTGNIIKTFSFTPSGYTSFFGLTFAPDNNRLWTLQHTSAIPNREYVLEIGTTSGNIIGSFNSSGDTTSSIHGIAFDNGIKKLWYGDGRFFLIGTTDGSFQFQNWEPETTNTWALEHVQERNRLWQADNQGKTLNELGATNTYVQFSTPFGQSPDIGIVQIGSNKGVFIGNPSLGSFWLKGSVYPAKAMWMAWGSR